VGVVFSLKAHHRMSPRSELGDVINWGFDSEVVDTDAETMAGHVGYRQCL
jgi:hypothetical protein